MDIQNSLVSIWLTIASDLNTSPLDRKTFTRRMGSGLPFLVKDLPALGKDLDRALITSELIITSRFKLKRNTKLPVFLHEKFLKLFSEDGILIDYPSSRTIKEIRQLLFLCYKFEFEMNSETEAKALEKFKACDDSVKTDNWPWYLAVVRRHFVSLLPEDPFDIRPHHSNGATADGFSNEDKRYEYRVIPKLHETFKFSRHFQSFDHLNRWNVTRDVRIDAPTSKLTFVPKDSRGPRTICMEPHEIMFFQKGLQVKLYNFIESSANAGGYINFTDQGINQDLARLGSIDGSLATIDLKDASDMVSNSLIRTLLRDKPDWLEVLDATRSAVVTYKDERIPLKKYAPMGSALCFPIEAMLFWSILRPLTTQLWVYGDDIILPANLAEIAMSRLEDFGLIVNRDKSLFKGLFRESCGGEYYRGNDISYLKLKSLSELNFIAFCNNYSDAYGSADELIRTYEDLTSSIVFRWPPSHDRIKSRKSFVYYTNDTAVSDVFFERRWNEDLHRYERRIKTVVPNSTSSESDEQMYFDWQTNALRTDEPEEYFATLALSREYDTAIAFGSLRRVLPLRIKPKREKTWSLDTRNKFKWVPEMALAT